jgi:hypothetical protein
MCASASGTGIRARTGRGLRKPIQEYWVSKTERNVARDRDNVEEWKRQSWDVLVLWECQAKEREALKRVILAFLPRRLKARTEQLQGAGVTLNYNPVMHFHGVEGEPWLRSQLAQHHRYAADQFQRMLAEAEYRLNRSRFDGAQPV